MTQKMWNTIPAISYIAIENGKIELMHHGVLDNKEVAEMASKIIEPYMQTNLKLMSIEKT